MAGVRFEMTINLGHVLTIVALLASGFAAYASIEFRISRMEDRTSDYVDLRDRSRDNEGQIKAILSLATEAQSTARSLTVALGSIQQDIAVIKAQGQRDNP
jgi:hypothetical protein